MLTSTAKFTRFFAWVGLSGSMVGFYFTFTSNFIGDTSFEACIMLLESMLFFLLSFLLLQFSLQLKKAIGEKREKLAKSFGWLKLAMYTLIAILSIGISYFVIWKTLKTFLQNATE